MKISMHIVCDWINHHTMHTKILSGKLTLDKVRFCVRAEDATDPNTLYLLATSMTTDTGNKNGVLCLNENDRVFIEADTPAPVFSEILEIFDFYESIEKAALEQINSACSQQELLETLSKGLKHNIFIINSGCKLMSFVNSHPSAPVTAHHYTEVVQAGHLPLPQVYQLLDIGLLDVRITEAATYSTDFFPYSHTLRDIYRFNERVARISVPEDIGLCSIGECQYVDIVSEILRLWYEKTNFTSADFSPAIFYRNILMDEKSSYSMEDYLFYSHMLKWSEPNEKFVVCIDIAEKKDAVVNFALFHLRETLPQLQPFISENFICLVMNADEKETEQLKIKLTKELKFNNMHAGISYPFYDITNLTTAYEEAKIGALYGSKEVGVITKCSNCKLEYIHSTLKKNLKMELTAGKLYQLKEYDAQHNTDYYKTLYIYLLNERNQSLTAELLNMHRNTLNRRIEKIYSIIGTELDSPVERLSLLFSFFSKEENPLNHMQ